MPVAMDFAQLIAKRWSPREFTSEPVAPTVLAKIFETAHWAQSSYNEQPWHYVIALADGSDARKRLESFLVEGNAFAKAAPVLGVAYARTTFTRNGKLNRVAQHDLGAANQVIAIAAWEHGLNTRFMAGFDLDQAEELAPAGFDPIAMFVIGRATPQALAAGPGDRGRRPVKDFVFQGEWGKPAF
jgi:nitroreductase